MDETGERSRQRGQPGHLPVREQWPRFPAGLQGCMYTGLRTACACTHLNKELPQHRFPGEIWTFFSCYKCVCVAEHLYCVCMCVCVGHRAMTTAACALTGGFITASDRASSKTLSEEYTLCVGQNKHPASSGGTINYLYHRQNSKGALNIATCSSGRVKDDLCLMATLNFTAIGPCAFWGLGRHKMVVINCCSCFLETQNWVESGPAESSGFCLFLHNTPWSSSSSSVSSSWSVGHIEIAFYFCLNATMPIL